MSGRIHFSDYFLSRPPNYVHKTNFLFNITGDQPVQFVPGQPLNGDAKVEIGDAGGPPAFVGLGKEELMKYANDPFWVGF